MPKETILLAGGVGSGKSTWLVQMIHEHIPSDQPVWIFDNERKIRGVAELFGPIPDNVTIYSPTSLVEASKHLNQDIIPEVRGKPEGYGVIMIDMLNFWWEKAQMDYHAALIEGDQDYADYMLEVKKAKEAANKGQGTTANPFEGFTDWPIIKASHNKRLIEPILYDTPSHVLMTATSRDIRDENTGSMQDAPGRRAMWGSYNQIPEGEKYNDSRVVTCMGLMRSGLMKPEYHLWLCKDRSRQLGKVEDYFEDVKIIPDEDTGVFDLWWEFTSRRKNAPEMLIAR